MSENLKIRFRLPNGEEFEAEGPQDFIESQRSYFLSLVGMNKEKSAPAPTSLAHHAETSPNAPAYIPIESSSYAYEQKSDNTPSNVNTLRRLWEQLLKEEGECLILRRKARLCAQEAALLILAGSKQLLRKTAYSAILLSKSLKESGFDTARLDRLLSDEIKGLHITSQGSKRSRTYTLTPSGYAKAFVLAQKKVGETL